MACRRGERRAPATRIACELWHAVMLRRKIYEPNGSKRRRTDSPASGAAFEVPAMDNSLSLPTIVFLIWLGSLVAVLVRFS